MGLLFPENVAISAQEACYFTTHLNGKDKNKTSSATNDFHFIAILYAAVTILYFHRYSHRNSIAEPHAPPYNLLT